MKATAKKKELQEAASKASKIITRSILPIAQCMHMEVKNGEIAFSAFSNEMNIRTICKNVIADADFECVFMADAFMRFLSKTKSDNIDLKLEQGKNDILHLKCGQAKMKLQCTNIKEWPKRTEMKEPSFVRKTDFLFPSINQCKHALSLNESDPIMSAFCISRKGDDWNITALDGKRVSIRGCNFSEPEMNILINGSNLITLHSIFAASVKLEMKGEDIRISDENTEVYLRTVFGKYFNVNSIINTQTPLYFTANKEELQNTLELVNNLSVGNEKKIKFTISDKTLLIESNDFVGNELKCNVSVETNCVKEFVAGMNPVFILDAIKSIEQDEIKIEFMDKLHPFLIRGDYFTEVLMPIKVG